MSIGRFLPLNYRHHFHAGNFADVMKHALWLRLLACVQSDHPGRLEIIDTHAGAGLYDLGGPMAQKSREAAQGVERLMAAVQAPAALLALKAAVARQNPPGALRFYPGSPALSIEALRSQDQFKGWELRLEDQVALQALIDQRPAGAAGVAAARLGDGYQDLGRVGDARAQRLVLIDPPFERGDEAHQIVEGVARALAAPGGATVAIWAPLKDLETFDALLRALERLSPRSILAAEVRLRPLFDPMRLNGSVMIFIDGPDLSAEAVEVCDWVAKVCGGAGAMGRVRRLAGP